MKGSVMPAEVEAYEQLRSAVLLGQARPDGLAAVVYHGMLGGIKVIGAACLPAASVALRAPAVTSTAPPPDPALLRLLANMVLRYSEESTHVV